MHHSPLLLLFFKRDIDFLRKECWIRRGAKREYKNLSGVCVWGGGGGRRSGTKTVTVPILIPQRAFKVPFLIIQRALKVPFFL